MNWRCKLFGHKGLVCPWSAPVQAQMVAGVVLVCERCGEPLFAHPTGSMMAPPAEKKDDSSG